MMEERMTKTGGACPVCAGADTTFLLRSDADIYRCRGCSHTFSDLGSLVEHEKYEADYYESEHKNWFDHPNFALFAWIRSALPDTIGTILDAGCGKGDFLRYIKAHAPSVKRCVGMDYSPNTSTPDIEYLMGDLSTMQGDETFDAVVSLAVIEHVPDPLEFACILAGRCKKGGYVAVMTVNDDSILYRLARLMYRCGMPTPAARLYSSHHLQHFTVRSLHRTLEQAGFEILEDYSHNSPLVAVDLPKGSLLKRALLITGVAGVFLLGALTKRAYLQTVICRRV